MRFRMRGYEPRSGEFEPLRECHKNNDLRHIVNCEVSNDFAM